jgi:fructokinase
MSKRKPKLDVVTFGEILWDVFEVEPGLTDSHEGVPRGYPRGAFIRELGGAPANVAVNLAALGIRSAVVGGVGRDRFGDDLALFLEQNHVDPCFVIRFPNRTGLAFITRDKHGEPSFLFYRHDTADMAVHARDVTRAMGNASWVLIGTSTMVASHLAKATRAFLHSARKSKAHLVVDLNVRAHLWKNPKGMRSAVASVLEHAMLVKASTADLAALDVGNESKALAWVSKHAKNASIVLTRGKGNATALGTHGEISVGTKPKTCIDATGAGDAFIAGVLATLISEGASPDTKAWNDAAIWRRALEVGHTLGALAISKRGSVSGITNAKKSDREKLRRMMRTVREKKR